MNGRGNRRRDAVKGENLRTGGHWRDSMKIWCRGNSLKYIKAIITRSSNIRGDRVPNGHLLSPKKSSSTRTGLNSTEFLAKEFPWKFPYNPDSCKTRGSSFQTDLRYPLSSTQFNELGEVELEPTRILYCFALVSLVLEGALQSTKRET